MARAAPASGAPSNHKGRPVGTVVRSKHYATLPPVLRELEDERLRRGWTMDRLDMEAGRCPASYRHIINEGRACSYVILGIYAEALGKRLTITSEPKP